MNQKKFGLNDLKLKFKNEWVNSYKLYINENKKVPEINSLFKNKKFGNLLDYLSNYEKSYQEIELINLISYMMLFIKVI